MTEPRPLSQLIRLSLDQVDVDGTSEYPIAGVYGFGRGLFKRGPIRGSETSYKGLNRLRVGQLVVSRLKAFEGALAVVPADLDGWYLSPEFPTFACIDGALDPAYLAHICKWPEFWSMLRGSSRGIGARRERVHAEDLLRLELSVPGIEEQRLVAARLDRVASQVVRVQSLHRRATDLAEALVVSASTRPDLDERARHQAGWRRSALGDFLVPSTRQVSIDAAEQYRIAGIYSFGRGLIDRGVISGVDTSYKTLTVLEEGDVVVSKLGGWEGAVAVVEPRFRGFCVSSEFPTFTPDRSALAPPFFQGLARSPQFWQQVAAGTRGSMARRKRITTSEFLATKAWLPTLADQERVAEQLSDIDEVSRSRLAASERLDALLPAALNEAFAGLS